MVLDEDMLKMANGISLLFADDADDKNDYKNQITAFQFFLFNGTYAKGNSGSLCMCSTIRYLQHIPKNICCFRPSTAIPSSG